SESCNYFIIQHIHFYIKLITDTSLNACNIILLYIYIYIYMLILVTNKFNKILVTNKFNKW
ncbi:MAG: hypothetical protein N7Q72_06105, partial [Spiroplasma sp. Tabriz.8]|nr:hypothetical protein [Spiroplasma sp. Tabriz.8]